jgi:urease accessory protein
MIFAPTRVRRAGHWHGPASERLVLDYEGRFLRRKRAGAASGAAVMVDLPETVSLDAGDALEAEGGALVEIVAAPEPLLRITGDLARLAWHIGNRHTPCQVAGDHLLIRDDHVLADMLARLGAEVSRVTAPFVPEGGAYGHGRTHGHPTGLTDPGPFARAFALTHERRGRSPDAHPMAVPGLPGLVLRLFPRAGGGDRLGRGEP